MAEPTHYRCEFKDNTLIMAPQYEKPKSATIPSPKQIMDQIISDFNRLATIDKSAKCLSCKNGIIHMIWNGKEDTMECYADDGTCDGCIHKHHYHCDICGKIAQIG